MFWYLTILSILSTLSAGAIFVFLLKREEHLESLKFFLLGFLLMVFDFLIEYSGTSNDFWTYHQSVYFILDLVPIELMFLFFSTGVLAGFLFTRMNKIKIPFRVNTVFYLLILTGVLLHLRQVYMTGRGNLFYLSIIIGLWGFYNISEKNKESALALSLIAFVVDIVAEKLVIGAGGYSYKHGFDLSIPLIYSLLTLGLLALMEKMHKLDQFLEYPVVKNLLKVVGVKRERYKDKFNSVKDKVKERLKENDSRN